MAQLTHRQTQILNLAVAHFIKSAEPVASRTLVRTYKLPVGPATIRNEMADLEELGYLEQPHTSAGRVPTDRGYREYVDSLGQPTLTEEEHSRLLSLEEQYFKVAAEFQQILEHTLRILAEATNLVGVAELPGLGGTRLDKIQLIEVGHRKVLVVLVTSAGAVKTQVVGVDADVEQAKLDQISRIFNENFSRAAISDFVLGYVDVLREIRQEMRITVKGLLDRFFATIGAGASTEPSLLVEGASLALRQPDFANFERARELLSAVESKDSIVKVISQVTMGVPTQTVKIGHEIRGESLKDLSLVVGTYRGAGRADRGSIGIVGPRRMDYPRVMAIVAHITRLLERALRGENPGR